MAGVMPDKTTGRKAFLQLTRAAVLRYNIRNKKGGLNVAVGENSQKIQHIFIIGSKSIGQYGGYETFVDKLSEQHKDRGDIMYHIACKANGSGSMDETKLEGVSGVHRCGRVTEFKYNNAHVFKLPVPEIGSAAAIYYDVAALRYSIGYCRKHRISHPIFYILACRIGPVMGYFRRAVRSVGGRLYINPDGHEWKRAKWSPMVRRYWKLSEKLMVKNADLVVCDSLNIEKYIRKTYSVYSPETTYIAYGADTRPGSLSDDDKQLLEWYSAQGTEKNGYYLVVGRFVPENNYETMIREFMSSHSERKLIFITNTDERFMAELEERLHFSRDSRIVFAGTVYDKELLKKLRGNAYGYIHGHEVGGTNPSLVEALGYTKLNLLLGVGFNREVALGAALYWKKDRGDLAALIDRADRLSPEKVELLGRKAKERVRTAYSWKFIGDEYMKLWRNSGLR